MKPEPQPYTSAVFDLLAIDVAYPLVPKQPASVLHDQLAALTHADIFGDLQITDPNMADACLSGLWLRLDFLDRSHTISQDISTPTGSYWHGIMHRREGDWSNAKYWFRQVGEHEVFADLLAAMRRIARNFELDAEAKSFVKSAAWDPYAFVDLCQRASRDGSELETFCREVQMAEWELLFSWCYQRAVA